MHSAEKVCTCMCSYKVYLQYSTVKYRLSHGKGISKDRQQTMLILCAGDPYYVLDTALLIS
jgi:hypothetical protein